MRRSADIEKLVRQLDALVVVEHDLRVIAASDRVPPRARRDGEAQPERAVPRAFLTKTRLITDCWGQASSVLTHGIPMSTRCPRSRTLEQSICEIEAGQTIPLDEALASLRRRRAARASG